jgi:trans-aconitate methyltransferase
MHNKHFQTPYQDAPALMAAALFDQSVNRQEHEIYWPQFRAMLPETTSAMLDFGCGSGYSTKELATKYPHAQIRGTGQQRP